MAPNSLTDCLLVTKEQMYLFIPSRDQAVGDPTSTLSGMAARGPPAVVWGMWSRQHLM